MKFLILSAIFSIIVRSTIATTWYQDSTNLEPIELSNGDRFGGSLSVSGDKLAVAAYWDDGDGGGSNRGIVYTYQWSGSAWIQDASALAPSELSDNDSFGQNLDMDGDKLIVSTQDAGTYTYQWSGSAWVKDTTILTESGYVSLSGDKMAIGYSSSDVGGTDRGIVYTYQWSGSAWVKDGADIQATQLADSDRFGQSLSMDGNKLAVSAGQDDDIADNAGAVYTFQWSGSAWVQDGPILAPTGLGSSVA